MQQRNLAWLILIGLLVLGAAYVAAPGTSLNFNLGNLSINQTFDVHQGLDLRGGVQVLLEADLPGGCASVEDRAMASAQQIVERRVNGLGLTEPLVQRQGNCRIVVELPGVSDPQQAINTIKETGQLEFVALGFQPLPAGTVINTDCVNPAQADCGAGSNANIAPTAPPATGTPTLEATASLTATVAQTTTVEAASPTPGAATPTATSVLPTPTTVPTSTLPTYQTVMSGVALREAIVETNELGQLGVSFTLTDEGRQIFGDFTASHPGEYLAIVVDKEVISSPQIDEPITQGSGFISGRFTQEEANQLALQLRYGALPVPLKVAQSREIGPTLGQDSIRRSAIAGVIGLTTVVLFMLLYYRLPGVIASFALLVYAVITFALFKLIPVTLTLPGIAGFVLSVGVAVDANILIFERMKEELRAGRNLRSAVETGFSRAWPSIRDSNISTLITCAILYWFGNTFGASIVKGFALTLALGVGVSLFTAILVTRSILHLFLDRIDFSTRHSWFGI
jgi:preprotein translocase subunit SecD